MKPFYFFTSILFYSLAALFLSGLLATSAKAQAQETKEVVQKDSMLIHSAKKAALMSMALPGLGQAYNKKYWKIPIIYAGFGVFYYFISTNGQKYRDFRDAYSIVATNDSANFNNEYVVKYNGNLTQLAEGRNYYRRNLELTYILTGLLYILNIVDASVDGNLYNFDVSDDLSLRFEAGSDQYFSYKPVPALVLRYRF